MAHARIDRMVKELNAEPSFQFFGSLFGLLGLARPGRQTGLIDSVSNDCIVAAFVAQRPQGSNDDRVSVDLEKAA